MAKRFSVPPVPTGEVANYTSDPYLQNVVYGAPWGVGAKGDILIRPQDELLIQKGGNQALGIYQKLFFDSTTQSAWSKIVQDVISRRIMIKPVSNSPGDIAIKEFVENQIGNLPMDRIFKGFLEAYLVGLGVGEVLWKKTPSGNRITDIALRDVRRFRFVETPDESGFSLRVLTRENMFDGLKVPPRKFITFRYWAQANGDPYGCGLGRILYPLVKFKRRAVESHLLYSDRYANPTAVATAPLSATTQEIETLYNHLSNLSQETALVLPEGYTINFINPSGSPDTFTDIRESLVKEINMLVTGEDEAGNSAAGSRASSEVALRVREIRAQELSELLCETLDQTLIRWIVDLNFGVDVESPKITRDFSVGPTTKLTMSDVATLVERIAYFPKKSWIAETFKVELEDEVEEEEVETEEDVYLPEDEIIPEEEISIDIDQIIDEVMSG